MISEVLLPVLGETVNECTIVEWYKAEGDPIARGEPLFSVESDKAVLDVEATAAGFLRRVLVPAGAKVPVLAVVALVTSRADEPIEGEWAAREHVRTEGAEVRAEVPAGPSAEAAAAAAGRLLASPRARRAAREKGVDLAGVTGSGPGGRIVERDVEAHAAARPKASPLAARAAAALGVDLDRVAEGSGFRGRIMKADVEAAAQRPPAGEASPATPAAPAAPYSSPVAPGPAVPENVPVTGLRRIIAERMAASSHATARVTLMTEVDATALVEAREQLKAAVEGEWGFAPSYNDLLALIVARALREFTYMNARLCPDGQAIERLPFVNLGIAVDTGRGLVVPVIRDADRQGLRALGAQLRALVERARSGKSLPDDLSGGTFTITNLGMYDVDAFTPIINLPEAAILGAGRIRPTPAVREGQIVVRQMWVLSLTFDHRLVDGAPAARFLQQVSRWVESPYMLLG